ncbi:MAG: HlyC/CorC family transporter [Flavobacteriales bacterium]|nr:HlyC/CorC family transporter [Flavobacteriales bacterium]
MDTEIIAIIVSLLFSAFFSGMEIAYLSANRVRLSMFKTEKSWVGQIISYLLERPDKYIATMLVGNNIALVVYGYFMGDLIIDSMYPQYAGVEELPFSVLLVQTLISTGVILVTGEFMPKTIFRVYASEVMEIFAIPVYVIYVLFNVTGISGFMLWISNTLIRRVFHRDGGEKMDFSIGRMDLGYYIEEQIEQMTPVQREKIDKEINIFRNALEFRDVKARECMVPRTDITALDINATIDELKEEFIASGLSKIIVYRETIDNILGYVHSFDLFKPRQESLKDMLLPVLYVPESMAVNDLLKTLTHKRMSVAIILDEYGGTSGMVTVEDIIEELLGDIEDEHDKETLLERDLGDGTYLFSARQEVDYINSEYNLELPESEEYETLGGLITHLAERIPAADEEITAGKYILTVKEASSSKVDTVHVRKKL